MRTALLAATAAVLFATVSVTAASAGSPWSSYVAPATACAGSDDVSAPAGLQKSAMRCLVNWTRKHVGLRPLRWSRMLTHAAGSKADIIASCGDFSHHPCGARWPASATRQRRYDVFGENLYYGTKTIASPREVLLAWLESPEHRAVLFGRGWRDLGVTMRPTRRLAGDSSVSIWVLEVAGRA